MALTDPADLVTVALVRPLYAFNVGQCSRAMGNLGFSNLALVDSQAVTDLNELDVRQGAARGQDALKTALQVNSVQALLEAVPGDPIVIAFSRRPGSVRPAQHFNNWLRDRSVDSFGRPTVLLFGSEDHGLQNDDLEFANAVLELPTYGQHGSYNLSHSVLLALYMLRDYWDQMNFHRLKNYVHEMSEHKFPESALQEWLNELKMPFNDRRQSAYMTIKNLLLRNELTKKEYGVLEAVIFQTLRKLREQRRE